MSSISDTSLWLRFFTEAGIPAGDATTYALAFTDNRIRQDMLTDLDKDYLRDLGVTVLGDVIAILKHAKVFAGRQRVLQASHTAKKDAPPAPPAKKSTPATRMLEHYVRKEDPPPPPAPAPALSHTMSARLSSGGVKRGAEDDDGPSANKRNSVFNRLGDNSVSSTTGDAPKITITMHGKDVKRTAPPEPTKKPPTSVFGRLGNKDANGGGDAPGKPLEYQGVLKYSAKEMSEKSRRKSPELPADTTSGVRSRLGLHTKTVGKSAGIFAREMQEAAKPPPARGPPKKPLGRTITIAPATSSSPPAGTKVIKKVIRVRKATGEIVSEKEVTTKRNVFSRLGN